MNNTPRRVVLKPRIAIFAYLKNLKAPIQTHFLKHYHTDSPVAYHETKFRTKRNNASVVFNVIVSGNHTEDEQIADGYEP